MHEIQLTRGHVALVDDADYERTASTKWWAVKAKHSNVVYAYGRVRVGNRLVRVPMHKLILGLVGSCVRIDHENGNGLDNQRHNLRVATNSQNMRNRSKYSSNTVGFKGVSPIKRVKQPRYRACIFVEGKQKHLGVFKTPVEAAKAYDKAARAEYGEFARLNFPDEAV